MTGGPALPLSGSLLLGMLAWIAGCGIRRILAASPGGPALLSGLAAGHAVEQIPETLFGRALLRAGEECPGGFLVAHGRRLRDHPAGSLETGPGSPVKVLLCSDPFDPSPVSLLTDPGGRVGSVGDSGGARLTNLCDSGVWIFAGAPAEGAERAECPLDALHFLAASGPGLAGEIAPGYTRSLDSREGYLVACHEILSGMVPAASGRPVPAGGILVEEGAVLGSGSVLRGTAWLRAGSTVGDGCILENCVLLEGSAVGRGSMLKNALVGAGEVVPPGTVEMDKYLKIMERKGP